MRHAAAVVLVTTTLLLTMSSAQVPLTLPEVPTSEPVRLHAWTSKAMYSPGEPVDVRLAVENQLATDVGFYSLAYTSAYFLVSDPQALAAALAADFDSSTGTLDGSNLSAVFLRHTWPEYDALWVLPPGATCSTPMSEPAWNQQTSSGTALAGLYIYVAEFRESPTAETLEARAVFAIGSTLAPPSTAPPLTEDCTREPFEAGPGILVASLTQGYLHTNMRWAEGTLPKSWRYNSAGVPTNADMTAAAAETAIRAALESGQWETDAGSYYDATYAGTTTNQPRNDMTDTVNAVGWRTNAAVSGARAVTWCFGSPPVECDIAFNQEWVGGWSAPNTVAGRLDLQDVATHEGRHFAGVLNDLAVGCLTAPPPVQTMCQGTNAGTADRRTLEWGDRSGIRFSYPTRATDVNSAATGARSGVGDFSQGLGIAAANIDGTTGRDAIVVWADNPSGDNTIYYRLLRNLVSSTGVPSTFGSIAVAVDGTATGARTGVGAETAGVGAAIGLIDSGTVPDLVVAWVDSASGSNIVYYRVGWNLQTSGAPASWSAIKRAVNNADIGSETEGIDICVRNIDGTAAPELIVSWVENPSGNNVIRWSIGPNLNTAGDPATAWSSIKSMPTGWVGDTTTDMGLACADLDTGNVDFVFAWIDAASGENTVHYRVGRNVTSAGDVAGWTPTPTSSSASAKRGPGLNVATWGATTDGFDLESLDLDASESDELLFAWIDAPSGANTIYHRVEWNGQFRHHS